MLLPSCPDEFEGFYPHLLSCDKYWHCQDGAAELRTCGNGLAFMDTDDTFTLEQCAEVHLVECGERTELEPPISTPNCPRLFGTFADTEDCGVFWNCQDGKANRYNCPPGLAYDEVRSKYNCEINRLSDLNLFTENFPGGRCRTAACG